ncbi:prepilin peptidase [Pseudomaricurvus alcaniphilus]|uniref:preprotein translocase subunit SecA n=1 Tax=Pseudomaricurvus alcaniphilus TaxID=1166482 RepID=UPI00140AAD05|nr:prepilin peptidase [Pseudomaricurvus alcaniphilus]
MSESVVAAPRLSLPGLRIYPERPDSRGGWQRVVGSAARQAGLQLLAPLQDIRSRRFVTSVNALGPGLEQLDDSGFSQYIEQVRADIVRSGLHNDAVARAFAATREAACRSIGLRHYDVQLLAGRAMLQGRIAELETGEGKTLTATLAAAAAAFAGQSVHVITVNDYLAQRDRELMAPVYAALGLGVGLVIGGMSAAERRDAYRQNITYCTNKEAAFDYLRDRMALQNSNSSLRIKLSRIAHSPQVRAEPVMRGLQFAIVDEADSVLIDEARTPLIISERTDPDTELKIATESLAIVAGLQEGEHYWYHGEQRQVRFTDQGAAALLQRSQQLRGAWHGRLYREAQARNAVLALHVFVRDQHYLVRDDKIEIIDENTGRVMPDRSWGDGLHQMLEVKESCRVTGQTIPLAQMTYQRFFRRYQRLAGMTGTAREAARELWAVYRLPVASIHTHRPLARVYCKAEVLADIDSKWQRIVTRTRELSGRGVPVLIGTRSVASSELASRYLQAAGVQHRVLNAAQDLHEAEIIAQAGNLGQVTVATNMAGRGVDIRLSPEVQALGGLHIIMSERHDSGRIDRQLFGRCARQGEPGQVEIYLSLEDALIIDAGLAGAAGRSLGERLFQRAQRTMERRHRRARRELMRWDEHSGTALSFAGRLE